MPGKLIVDEIEDSGGTSVIGRKNLVMNGDFRIAQRGSSFSPLTTGSYPADRWNWQLNGFSGAVDSSISTDTPTGFGSSLKLDCTTANTSVPANNFALLRTHWEGQDIQHLAYGTSDAKSVTISFWVHSTKTGTFNVSLYNNDAGYSYIVDETVDTASTWEKKTITISGDTANGFDNDENRSLSLYFTFSAGTDYQGTSDSWISGFKIASSNIDNFFDSTANEIYITGVQMEVGSVATDFEVRPIGEEQNLCDRYYQVIADGSGLVIAQGWYITPTGFEASMRLRNMMRTVPSLDQVTGTNYYRILYSNGSSGITDYINSFTMNSGASNPDLVQLTTTDDSGVGGEPGLYQTQNANAFLGLDAEL